MRAESDCVWTRRLQRCARVSAEARVRPSGRRSPASSACRRRTRTSRGRYSLVLMLCSALSAGIGCMARGVRGGAGARAAGRHAKPAAGRSAARRVRGAQSRAQRVARARLLEPGAHSRFEHCLHVSTWSTRAKLTSRDLCVSALPQMELSVSIDALNRTVFTYVRCCCSCGDLSFR